jgi:MFS family permease
VDSRADAGLHPPAAKSSILPARTLPVTLNARSLLIIGSTSGAWAFSFGLGSQVVSHWLKAQGSSDTVIGLSHSFYYFGLAVASCAVPTLTRRLGSTGCATLGMILAGITLALFPWGGGEGGWYLLRFLNGWAGAMSLVPLETIVSRDSPPDRKTQNFAYYSVSLTIGGALGIGIGLSLYQPGDTLAFYLGGCAPIAAGLMLLVMLNRPQSTDQHETRVPLGWRTNFLSFGTAWCQGFLEGGMLAFLTLFLLSRGFSESVAGTLMSVTMIGVIAVQVPVSWLADHYGKTPMLLGCYAVVALGLLTIPWLANSIWLAVGLFCFGACTGAMYPLGLSLLGERTPASGLARAYAWYLAIECVGSQVGAAAMGKARDDWGETAMFAVGFAAVVLVLTIWLGLRYFRRAFVVKQPADEKQRLAA